MRKLFCLFGFHEIIEIVTRSRYDSLWLNYFHCKHCGYDAEPQVSERLLYKKAKKKYEKERI